MRHALVTCQFVLTLLAGCREPGSQPPAGTPRTLALTAHATTPPRAAGAASETPGRQLAGAHFDVSWRDTTAVEDDARRVLERGELARAKFVELLGKERVGERRIRIVLAGEGGPRQVPTVDPDSGDIVLYRFPGVGGAYEAPLAHEFVHAIRVLLWTKAERWTDPAAFWEEGFAELLAREAGFPSLGFPLYGVDPDVAAASFVTRGEALPIARLVAEHRALNFRCMAQAYVERIAFMTYVRGRVGLGPMVALAYLDAPLDVPLIEEALGAKVTDLAAGHGRILAAIAARGDSRDAGTRFRETTPIRFLPVCSP